MHLEPLVEAHAVDMFALFGDPEMWTYLDSGPPHTQVALAARYRRLESRRSPDGTEFWLNWAVYTESVLIGFVQATVLPGSRALIAYFIGKRYWSRGFATDATRTMLTFLAGRFPKTDFEAVVDERNVSSLRLLRRLAFSIVDGKDAENLRLSLPAV
ncbi:MAG: GNAT family N-acetyltransferase [Candidatus Eremiobacteraeota bacterium]|nr:GNAT family N-acetyltransferase [Candidatus Eremiobacteraeota bacterium]